MKKQLVSIVVGMGIVSGCASSSPRPRPEREIAPVPARSFAIDWKATLPVAGGQELKELHLLGDRVFAYTTGQTAFVLSRDAGGLQAIENINAPGGLLREPLMLGDQVVYPTGTTFEIYGPDGELVRSVPLERQTRSGATAIGNLIYVGLDYPIGGRMAAIDLNRQFATKRWELQTFGGVSSKPVALDNAIYVASEDGHVYALDPLRESLWPLLPHGTFQTAGRIIADLKVDQTGVYVASTDGTLYVLDPSTGKVKWLFFGGSELTTAPILRSDTVYQYVPSRGIVAIDKNEGKYHRDPKWVVAEGRQYLSEGERYVYLRGKRDHILAVDKESGEIAFRSVGGDYEIFATNLDDDRIFAAQRNGRVVAIEPVLREGVVAEIASAGIRFEPVAMAK